MARKSQAIPFLSCAVIFIFGIVLSIPSCRSHVEPVAANPIGVVEPIETEPLTIPNPATQQAATPVEPKPEEAPAPSAPTVEKPLTKITITSMDTMMLRFTTDGRSAEGYAAHWTRITDGPGTAANDRRTGLNNFANTLQLNGVWRGSVSLIPISFESGDFEVYICQRIDDGCGVISQSVYVTATPGSDSCRLTTTTPKTNCAYQSVLTFRTSR